MVKKTGSQTWDDLQRASVTRSGIFSCFMDKTSSLVAQNKAAGLATGGPSDT